MKRYLSIGVLVLAAALGMASLADANAVISNGTVRLGVENFGELNASAGGFFAGVQSVATGHDGTRAGCECEGWGIAIKGAHPAAGTQGRAYDADGGASNLTLVSFASTATTATSVVRLGTATGPLEITHFFHPSASANLYQVDVTLRNTSGTNLAAGEVEYRRLMDWDIEPTAFNEFVTIKGVPALLGIANGTNLLGTSNDGFADARPLSPQSSGAAVPGSCTPDGGGAPVVGALNINFTDCGPGDHGALFDFEFAAIPAGGSLTFAIVYGVAPTEAAADAARAAVGVGLYSYGQSNAGGAPGAETFVFGFLASGGIFIPPTPPPSCGGAGEPACPVPQPHALLLLGVAMSGLGVVTWRRRR